MHTAVILNISQAKRFAASGLAADEVISFCPTVTHYLGEKKYRVTSTASIMGTFSHARVISRLESELPAIAEAATMQYGLIYAEAEGLRVYFYHYLSCIYLLYFSLRSFHRPGREFIWIEDKTIKQGDFDTMFASLARGPAASIIAYSYRSYTTVHYWFAALCNRILFARLNRSDRLKVIDYGDELPKRIVSAMIENGDVPLVLHAHSVGKNPLKTARFFIKSLARLSGKTTAEKPVYLFRAAPPTSYYRKVAPFQSPTLSAPQISDAVTNIMTTIVPFMRTEVAMGKRLAMGAQPQLAVSDHAKYPYILGGLEMIHAYGGKHAMLNHGTHTMQYDAISAAAAKLWSGVGRVIHRHTTHSLPKSPLTELVVKDLRTDGYKTYKINVYGKINNHAAREGKFVVLQAGNYTDPYGYIPWCKETADEYLLAILELVEECAKLPEVELIIKLKPKKSDTHRAIVSAHIASLGAGDRIRVDTTSKFSELMSRAHLIACNLSGTMEEALANQIPLMIHTYRKNYFHIPEQVIAPARKGELAPCYLVKKRSDIGAIITTLSKLRAGLNDSALYQTVAWQEAERMSMSELASHLAREARA